MQLPPLTQDTPNIVPVSCVASSVHVLPFHCTASGAAPAGPPPEPTAMQSELLRHDTPCRLGEMSKLSGGVVSIRQDVPFHCRATVSCASSSGMAQPTAMQLAVPLHETAFSPLSGPPSLGVLSTRQVVPFHASLITCADPGPPLPTAMQLDGLAHETPLNTAPAGLGGFTDRQGAPFHHSPMSPPPPVRLPTARQPSAVTQETPVMLPETGRLNVVQMLPFHACAVALAPLLPTAMQNEAPTQETPARW